MLRFLLALTLLVSLASAQYTYVSSRSVRDVYQSSSELNNVQPPFSSCVTGNSVSSCSMYLSSSSCLGYLGPLGAYGPLASLGPLQESNIDGAGDYEQFLQNQMTSWFSSESSYSGMTMPTSGDGNTYFQNIAEGSGPLSAAGPLGQNGPLGSAYTTTMPNINAFAAHLAAQGLVTVLGPLGPLGALGPLGPLSAFSLVSIGYTRDSNGNFLQNGNVVRNIGVPYGDGTTRTYELFEWYEASFASSMTNNDASFMVRDDMSSIGSTATFPFTSLTAQYVTILVLGEAQLDGFTLTLQDGSGSTIATADVDATFGLINWIQIYAPANSNFQAVITLGTSTSPLFSHPYRFFVVGSTSYIPLSTISGAMIIPWTPSNFNLLTADEASSQAVARIPSTRNNSVIAAVVAPIAIAALVVAIVVATRLYRRRGAMDLELHAVSRSSPDFI